MEQGLQSAPLPEIERYFAALIADLELLRAELREVGILAPLEQATGLDLARTVETCATCRDNAAELVRTHSAAGTLEAFCLTPEAHRIMRHGEALYLATTGLVGLLRVYLVAPLGT